MRTSAVLVGRGRERPSAGPAGRAARTGSGPSSRPLRPRPAGPPSAPIGRAGPARRGRSPRRRAAPRPARRTRCRSYRPARARTSARSSPERRKPTARPDRARHAPSCGTERARPTPHPSNVSTVKRDGNSAAPDRLVRPVEERELGPAHPHDRIVDTLRNAPSVAHGPSVGADPFSPLSRAVPVDHYRQAVVIFSSVGGPAGGPQRGEGEKAHVSIRSASGAARAARDPGRPRRQRRRTGRHQAERRPALRLEGQRPVLHGSNAPPTTKDCEQALHIACYAPFQLQNAYDLNSLYSGGWDGTGSTIAIVDSFGSPTAAADLAQFDADFGLPAPPSFKIIQPAGKVPPFDPGNGDMVNWAVRRHWTSSGRTRSPPGRTSCWSRRRFPRRRACTAFRR